MFKYLFGTPGPSGFGSASTALQIAQACKEGKEGKRAIVTGANSGIGFEAAKALASAGVHVVIACRQRQSGEECANEIRKEFPSAKLRVMELNLASGASIKKFASEYLALNEPLHYLINNAGVMACPKSFTEDGFENQLGTNHLGHFLLTVLLLDKIKSSGSARIVSVSSSAQAFASAQGIFFDDLDASKSYSSYTRYAQSKIANVYFISELQRRLDQEGYKDIICTSLDPGSIKTKLQRHLNFFESAAIAALGPFFKTPQQGAATTLFCAFYPNVNDQSLFRKGGFYSDCNVVLPGSFGTHPKLFDVDIAKQLWQVSERLWKEKGFLV